jgi:transaldolase
MSIRVSNPGSPLARLMAERQSIWLDYIHRTMIGDGELRGLIERRGVRGVTSNPTIFEQAIGKSDAYDEAIAKLAGAGQDTQAIYETLAIADIRAACDLFRPIYEMSAANDGYVSMEVSPRLARDTDATLAEARRLWKALDRPNAMIKIPGTPEGLPAVATALAEGININVTLLFAVPMYERVIDAYLSGIERRLAAGQGVETVRSVASFFVSRVDTETDKRLAALARPAETAALLGTAAVANAKIAYAAYTAHFEGDRFRAVMAKGAAVQRPLWASTGTKNPAYRDTKYVDDLIGPDTVNTMPPATLEAFADHGSGGRTIDEGVERARTTIAAIERLGVRLDDVTEFLVADGVKKFADSFTQLLTAIDAKRVKLTAAGLIENPLSR